MITWMERLPLGLKLTAAVVFVLLSGYKGFESGRVIGEALFQ
jgi:hypothetical protein